MEESDGANETARAMHAAGVILLLRGTAIGCAGLVAFATLLPDNDPVCRWAAVPLSAGLVAAIGAFGTMRGRPRMLWLGAPPILAWVLLSLTPVLGGFNVRVPVLSLLGVGFDTVWIALLPAFFLPDVYALWTLFRRRGRLFVARGMVALCFLSSLVVAWFGPALFLA